MRNRKNKTKKQIKAKLNKNGSVANLDWGPGDRLRKSTRALQRAVSELKEFFGS